MDLADPSVDPVVLLGRFVYFINVVRRPASSVDVFKVPDVCEWLWDVDGCGDEYRVYYHFYDALILVQVWLEGGLIVRDHKREREDGSGGWQVFVVKR
jgi:hypothetical protein